MKAAIIALACAMAGWVSYVVLTWLGVRCEPYNLVIYCLFLLLTVGPSLLALFQGLRAWRENAKDDSRFPKARMTAVAAMALGVGLMGWLFMIYHLMRR